ncbi:unnamed protein product [Brassica oleracea var. botrytis]
MLGGDVLSWFPLVSQLLIVSNSGTGFPSIRGLRGQKARYLREIEEVKFCLLQANECLLALVQVKPEVVSWSPRIIVLYNFLSSEECEYLKAIARPRLQVSTVVDIKTGKGVKSDVRTSSGILDLYNTRADLRKKDHLAIDKYALRGLSETRLKLGMGSNMYPYHQLLYLDKKAIRESLGNQVMFF